MTVAVALLIPAMTAAAVIPLVPTAARAEPQPAIALADSSLVYGQAAEVTGGAGSEAAGRPVALEFAAAGASWQVVGSTRADAGGRYSFRVRLAHSGSLRVAVGGQAGPRSDGGGAPGAVAHSSERSLAVAASLTAVPGSLDVLRGRAVSVGGLLRPGRPGRPLTLQRFGHGGWRTVARARTARSGAYRLRYVPRGLRRAHLRVAFAGDAGNSRAAKRIGRLQVYRTALASRYNLYGGALACGGSLGYRSLVVAHKTLPCGAKVGIRYRGRAVTATVQDRGPYVGGREFDLAGAVARRLGFDGVGVIWVSP
jgi:hypothetical protein